MIFDHIVKYNDVRYMAGEDVPIENKPTQKPEQLPDTSVDNKTEETTSKRRGRPTTKKD